MTAGLASFAVLRTQRAYNTGRAALLDAYDRGIDAISWVGDYISRLYGLGHHLFQNFWRDFRANNVYGQYEMVKRLINTIVPIRRGWRALSAVLGASLYHNSSLSIKLCSICHFKRSFIVFMVSISTWMDKSSKFNMP